MEYIHPYIVHLYVQIDTSIDCQFINAIIAIDLNIKLESHDRNIVSILSSFTK